MCKQGSRGRGFCSCEHWRPDQQPPPQHALCQRASRAAFCECSLSLHFRLRIGWKLALWQEVSVLELRLAGGRAIQDDRR